ncbi:MAG: cyclic nucleotide-binding domain-containing protein [Bdellovibrionota bacterium]
MRTQPDIEDKKIFLIVSPNDERRNFYSDLIRRHVNNSTVFTAKDGAEALFKVENVPPHILITDFHLPKLSGADLIDRMLHKSDIPSISIIVASSVPEKDHFVDEIVTGRLQFLLEPESELKFVTCVANSLNVLHQGKNLDYTLHFLAPEQYLFKEGEEAHCVYILRTGKLQAIKSSGNKNVVLGEISPGEFVGEMSHINKEPRSASVLALTDCELIEIPTGSLDMVLFTKPVWAQALVKTLSKRLKRSNEVFVEEN